jgi:hypothetical protein
MARLIVAGFLLLILGPEMTLRAQDDPCCDKKKEVALAKAAAAAYAPLFYDNNFDYLCDEANTQCYFGDCFKRRCLGDSIVYDIGGQYRLRYHNEHNHRGLGLTGRDDRFLLHRTRLFGNFEWGDMVRVYVEAIDAESNYEDFAPRPIEVNRSDIQNLFADVRLAEIDLGDVWARVGRQELLYGNERLVSPLDWANTRRTFEGAKIFVKGPCWDIDAFWVQPIYPDDHAFDHPDNSQEFMGVYATYKGAKDQTLEFYGLRFLDSDDAAPFDYNTLGSRWLGKRGNWLWELEAAYQFGDVGPADNSAGFYTVGLGRALPDAVWKPTFWAFYDWASGDDIIGTGFHHQFPLSHKYLGWMDLFGRRNIEDLNFQLTASPTSDVKLTAWWHIFHLQNRLDVPYNVVMRPLATLPGGEQDLGQELDLTALWNINARWNLLLGYSHFWRGDFWGTNPSPGLVDADADFYYAQLTWNF